MLLGICGSNSDHHIKDFPPVNLLVGTLLQTIKIHSSLIMYKWDFVDNFRRLF